MGDNWRMGRSVGKNGIETPREEMEVCSSQVVQTIPMNLLGRKSCSAEASTIFEFHLHCTKNEFKRVLLCNSSFEVIGNSFRSHNLISKLYLVPPTLARRMCNRYHIFYISLTPRAGSVFSERCR